MEYAETRMDIYKPRIIYVPLSAKIYDLGIYSMKNHAIKWLYAVPEKKKLYILALMLVQALHGASGVLYALLLRNLVDNAAAHDKAGFWLYVVYTILLVLGQVGLRAVIRWLNELSKATFENIFKARLMRVSCERTSQA